LAHIAGDVVRITQLAGDRRGEDDTVVRAHLPTPLKHPNGKPRKGDHPPAGSALRTRLDHQATPGHAHHGRVDVPRARFEVEQRLTVCVRAVPGGEGLADPATSREHPIHDVDQIELNGTRARG
jgi:hypothetical protein